MKIARVMNKIDNLKLINFLNNIAKGYKRSVQYHNDLHGIDVMQMSYYFIKHGNLN